MAHLRPARRHAALRCFPLKSRRPELIPLGVRSRRTGVRFLGVHDDEAPDQVYGRRMAPWASEVMCLGHVTESGEPVLMLFADAAPDVDQAMAEAGLLTVRGRLTRAVWSEAQAMLRTAAKDRPPGGFQVEFSMFPDGASGAIRMNVSRSSEWGAALAREVAERFPGLTVTVYWSDHGPERQSDGLG